MSPEESAFRPSEKQIWDCFSPFVLDEPWEPAAARLEADIDRAYLARRLRGWLRVFRRNQTNIAGDYHLQWQDTPLERQLSRRGAGVPCQWNEQRFIARAIGTKRVHLLHLFRAVQALAPRSILEVGAGNGVNLLALAARFPDLSLSGIELTAGGVKAAQSVAESARLPDALLEFLPEPAARTSVAGLIDLRQGDARKLPFADAAFDMVFTSLALEQMEEIRDAALHELARVSARWVVMIEPFRDFNDSGLFRRYVVAQDYFAARVDDLRGFGLEPIFASADMPHKTTLRPAIVVARKT